MNNTYPIRDYKVPVNNFDNWNVFNGFGLYEVANDNGDNNVDKRYNDRGQQNPR